MAKSPNIASAIGAVMQAVGYVQKTGKHPKQGYTFATEADLLKAMRGELAAHGLAFSIVDIEPILTNVYDIGKHKLYHVIAKYVGEFRHAASGEKMRACTLGEGMAYSQDTACYKANTGANKYILRQVFLLETGDHPEKPDRPMDVEAYDVSTPPEQIPADKAGPRRAVSEGEGARSDLIVAYCEIYEATHAAAPPRETWQPGIKAFLHTLWELRGEKPASDAERYSVATTALRMGEAGIDEDGTVTIKEGASVG